MLIYSLFRSAREGPADKHAFFLNRREAAPGGENLVNPSPEPGLYKGTYPSVLRVPERGGVKKAGAREAKEITSACVFIFLAAVAFIHTTPAATSSTSPTPKAKQRPRSESREPGKKPWRLASSSEAPQVNLLSSPNSSTFLHAHTRPLAFAGSSSIHVAEKVLYEHVMETPSR